ncbi:MAG: hypothetical protein V3U52_07060 [Thermoplasmata archaeon]
MRIPALPKKPKVGISIHHEVRRRLVVGRIAHRFRSLSLRVEKQIRAWVRKNFATPLRIDKEALLVSELDLTLVKLISGVWQPTEG